MKPIVVLPNPILTTSAKMVTVFDKKLALLVTDMKNSLIATRNPKGVGLAAPQIGQPWRVFVTRPKVTDSIRVFINPKIVHTSSILTDGIAERDNKLEGCLSIPKIWGMVKRATSLTLTYQDEAGKAHEEKFGGFLATIIQHETDHVNGILFTHRVLEQKDLPAGRHGKLYQAGQDETGKEILEEITLK